VALMPTVTLSPIFRQQFFGNDGKPLSGGKLFSYLATTTTKTSTYTDSTGGTPNANPVVLDFRGEANVWIEPNKGYKFVLAPANDTDPPTSPIWSVDNVKNNQLLTLYGGVDTGSANAYVLTFTANFAAYTDGTVIYWVPSNTNTASSTLNVNGLGIVVILNQNGGSLAANQIVANQIVSVMYRGGNFILLSSGQTSNASGTFNLTAVGFTTSPSVGCKYDINGHSALIQLGPFTATSNTTGFTLTGLPAFLQPVQTQQISIGGTVLDNSAVLVSSEILFTGSSGTVTITKLGVAAAFTAAATKGFNQRFTVAVLLN
jgi:hypothetical protein